MCRIPYRAEDREASNRLMMEVLYRKTTYTLSRGRQILVNFQLIFETNQLRHDLLL